MVKRLSFALALTLAFNLSATFAFGQKFEGPKKAEARTLIELKVTGELGDDPQIKCFPESGNWKVVRSVNPTDTALIIMFVPVDSEDGCTFTFLFLSNKDKKNLIAEHQLMVGSNVPKPKPIPPVPGPIPTNRFTEQLKAVYMVSPDSEALDKLIGVLMQVQTTKFSNFGEAATVLKNSAKRDVDGGGTVRKLSKVRDEIAYSILAKEIGDDGDQVWPQNKFEGVLQEVIIALKGLK